jgi:LmbE family N-acetylglucosaminyl deacetylase
MTSEHALPACKAPASIRVADRLAAMARRQVRRFRPTWLRSALSALDLDDLAPPSPYALPPSGGLLVLAPHPDDESIGCGALIAAFRAAGRPVEVIVLTDGAMGGAADRRRPDDTLAALRQAETRAAIDCLGGAGLTFLAHPDGRLIDGVDAAAGAVAAAIEALRPSAIAFPALYDRHPDHVACTPILLGALDRTDWPAELLGYETWAPGRAQAILDATPFMDAKVAAIACHRSQTVQRDYAEAMLGLARYRAITGLCPGHYGEVFWRGSRRALRRAWRAAGA